MVLNFIAILSGSIYLLGLVVYRQSLYAEKYSKKCYEKDLKNGYSILNDIDKKLKKMQKSYHNTDNKLKNMNIYGYILNKNEHK